MPFNGEPGRIRTLSYTCWRRAPLASRDSDSWLETCSSIGGSGETRTPKGFNPSRFQDDVLSRFASLPVKTSLGFEPNTFSFAAKTHAIWLEIMSLCQNLGLPSFDLRKLGKGTGFEPAQRHCRSEETRFLRQVTNPLENTSDSSRQPVHPKPATVFDLCHTCSVCR
jgi:hypothetical protein